MNESSNLYISSEELSRYSKYPQKRIKIIYATIGCSIALILGVWLSSPIAESITPSCKRERDKVEQEEKRRKSMSLPGRILEDAKDVFTESELDKLSNNLEACESGESLLVPLALISIVLISSLLLYFSLNSFQRKMILTKRKKMVGVWKKVSRFNEILKLIEVQEELEKVRNRQISPVSKTKLMKILEATKNNLIAELKTDGILFENPNYHPDKFSFDLSIINEPTISEQATEYGEIFTEIMNLNMEIQDESSQDRDS